MKSVLAGLLLLGGITAQASNVELIVEQVDNNGLVPGQTFRVYAQLPSPQHTLHAIFGEPGEPMAVHTSGSFYQHPLGNYSSVDVNAAMVQMDPALAYDSWVTIGAENNAGNNLWTIGVDYSTFENGSGFSTDNGAWFVVPTDQFAKPASGSLVLLMQVTTTGVASGNLNLQGWDQEGMPWQARNLTFSTTEAEIFGCTDAFSANYNSSATFDDGSCMSDMDAPGTIVGVEEVGADKLTGIKVFPNPIWEGQFNLQFEESFKFREGVLIIEIFDGAGKRVLAQEVGSDSMMAGNRIIVRHDLSSGTYTVNARNKDFSASTQIVVTR